MPGRNEASVTYKDQAEPDAGSFANIERVWSGYYTVSGLLATAQVSPDGTVALTAGAAQVGDARVAPSAGNVSVISGGANPDSSTALAADATNARYSLIVVNASGQLGVLHGDAAGLAPSNDGTYLCVWPDYTGKTLLAEVFVPPAFTTVAAAQVIDQRILVPLPAVITPTALSAAANDYNPTSLSTAHRIRQATNNGTQRNISGLAGGYEGREIWFDNLGPGPIGLLDESASSAAANRFALAGDIVLPVDRSVLLKYDVTSARWRIIGGFTLAAAPTIALGTAAAPGTSPYGLASDATILAFDATVPEPIGTAAAGDSATAAHRNHVHPRAPSALGSLGVRESDDMLYSDSLAVAVPTVRAGVFTWTLSGAGSATSPQAGEANHPGIQRLDTGTATSAFVVVRAAVASILFGGGRARYGAVLKSSASLSDGTNRYEICAGFVDSATGAVVDGAFIHYIDNVNGGKWEGKTSANSVTTVLDLGVTFAVSTWYFLEVEVNAAGTSVEFFINGVSKGTISTNIPTGAGRETGCATYILKSLGTTARTVDVDRVELALDFTTPR